MCYRFDLLTSALALIVASNAMAYDYGTKATATQNIENRPNTTQPAISFSGPLVKHYDKAGVASLNREADLRQVESSRTTVESATGLKVRSSAYKPTYYSTHDE